jgi:hypothetical protein
MSRALQRCLRRFCIASHRVTSDVALILSFALVMALAAGLLI